MDLEQSREILKLVSKFGEVEYYRNLKYDTLTHPNAAIVIFKHEKDAWEFQKNAPIRFRMGRAGIKEEPKEHGRSERRTYEESITDGARRPRTEVFGNPAPSAMAQTRSMTTTANDLPRAPPRPPVVPFQREVIEPRLIVDARIFQIITSPSRAVFRDQINFSHFHGRFIAAPLSIAQKSLVAVVPLPGLTRIDWRVEPPAWRRVNQAKEEEHKGPNRRKPLSEIYEERSKAAKSP
jgi:hypothetical protein